MITQLVIYWIMNTDGNSAKFAIADAKLHVPVVTSSTKDSANLAKQLNEGFKRSVYWNSYETKPTKVIEQGKKTFTNYLMHDFMVLKDYLFLVILLLLQRRRVVT